MSSTLGSAKEAGPSRSETSPGSSLEEQLENCRRLRMGVSGNNAAVYDQAIDYLLTRMMEDEQTRH